MFNILHTPNLLTISEIISMPVVAMIKHTQTFDSVVISCAFQTSFMRIEYEMKINIEKKIIMKKLLVGNDIDE
jgi:hypothetical protein